MIAKGNGTLIKLDPMSKLNVIINRKSNEKNRLIEVELLPTQVLGDAVLVYANIKVDQSGYYNISNQLAIKCKKLATTDVLQFGVCDKDFNDFSKCFNSQILGASCEVDHIISNNLCSLTYLDAKVEYIAWCNFQSSDNVSFEFNKQYSNIKLIKL